MAVQLQRRDRLTSVPRADNSDWFGANPLPNLLIIGFAGGPVHPLVACAKPAPDVRRGAGRAESGVEDGDPGWIRTSDPQLRRLMLYPAELRGRVAGLPAAPQPGKTALASARIIQRTERFEYNT